MTYFVVETAEGSVEKINYSRVNIEFGGMVAFRDEAGGYIQLILPPGYWTRITRVEGDL